MQVEIKSLFLPEIVKMFTTVTKVLVGLHRDEDGMEAVQIIMTLAVAALVVLGVTQMTGILDKGKGGVLGAILDLVGDFLPTFMKPILGK
jgi:hypothetical protein